MKVYLSVPMIANRSLGRAEKLANAIKDSGNEVTSPWVLGPIEKQSSQSLNIFERDMKGAESCDVIVADISRPSTGVGMELMAAYKAGKRIITVAEKGSVISRMLQHMDRKEMIEFETDDELVEKLKAALAGARASTLNASGKENTAELRSDSAPQPIGPYSQGVAAAGLVFCSGQIGVSRETGRLEPGIAAQTRRALENIEAVLSSAGLGLKDVVKTTVFLTDMAEFSLMNQEYGKFFKKPFPARSTVQVAALPAGARVEIEAIAAKS